MDAHPAAAIFPLMEGAEFDALVEDIRAHGLREPVVVHDGLVLDGRNRLRACEQVGLAPVTTTWDGDGSPEDYVVSKNLHRRHLTDSQRGLIAATLATRTKAETQYTSQNQKDGTVDQIWSTRTLKQAADLLNTSRTTVIAAKKVLRRADPDDIAAIKAGRATIHGIDKKISRGVINKKPIHRKLTKDNSYAERGESIRATAKLFGKLRQALHNICDLPRSKDMVAIARAPTKARVIDEHLTRSLKWLQEFEHDWRNRG